MSQNEKINNVFEWFRLITPMMLTIVIFLCTGINSRLEGIETKLFSHMTNHEMHTPSSMVISKAEFEIYQQMRDRQMADLKEGILRIENHLTKENK